MYQVCSYMYIQLSETCVQSIVSSELELCYYIYILLQLTVLIAMILRKQP